MLGAALASSTASLADVAGALFGPRGASLLLLATAVVLVSTSASFEQRVVLTVAGALLAAAAL